jgi:hypothetical protein
VTRPTFAFMPDWADRVRASQRQHEDTTLRRRVGESVSRTVNLSLNRKQLRHLIDTLEVRLYHVPDDEISKALLRTLVHAQRRLDNQGASDAHPDRQDPT